MRKIVQEVIEAEGRAGAVLEEARARASERKRSADAEISEKIAEARRQAQEVLHTTVEEAEKEAQRLRAQAIERADRQAEELRDGRTDVMEDLVNRICRVILSTETPNASLRVGDPTECERNER